MKFKRRDNNDLNAEFPIEFIACGTPEEFICVECGVMELKEGFRCNARKITLCVECGKKFDMHRCVHAGGEHVHRRFKRAENASD